MSPSEHHEARRLCLQLLCALDVQGEEAWSALERFLDEETAPAELKERARSMARETFSRLAEWDVKMADVSQRWDVKRMALVDRNILRLALWELSQPELTPVKVTMDEAIELAKEYGAEDSPAFVNGVLDAIWRKGGTSEATERRSDEGEGQ